MLLSWFHFVLSWSLNLVWSPNASPDRVLFLFLIMWGYPASRTRLKGRPALRREGKKSGDVLNISSRVEAAGHELSQQGTCGLCSPSCHADHS